MKGRRREFWACKKRGGSLNFPFFPSPWNICHAGYFYHDQTYWIKPWDFTIMIVYRGLKITELKNSFPVTFSALGINLQKNHNFSTQIINFMYNSNSLVMTLLKHESKMLFGIFKFSIVRHLEWFPKCIACYLFMAS